MELKEIEIKKIEELLKDTNLKPFSKYVLNEYLKSLKIDYINKIIITKRR